MNTRITRHIVAATLALATAIPAHAQFLGVLQGATNIFNQATSKIGAGITGANKTKDLQAERDRFFEQLEAQTQGMDKTSKATFLKTGGAQWSTVENAILLNNAKIVAEREAPFIDLGQVAKATVGGLAVQAGLGAGAGMGADLGNVMTSSAINGVLSGIGAPSSNPNYAGHTPYGATRDLGSAAAAGLTAGATNAIGNTISKSVKGGVEQAMASGTPATTLGQPYKSAQAVNPLKFFDQHPQQLNQADLYRANGHLGWKRIEASADGSAQAYAPITGHGPAKAAVFNFDSKSGGLNAAFRVLAVDPIDFVNVVQAFNELLGEQHRYSSTGSIVRAVWSSGAFVINDGSKVTAGWSALVAQASAGTPASPVQSRPSDLASGPQHDQLYAN